MDELPDKVLVPLGRRGFDPIPLKYCHVCQSRNSRLTVLEKDESEKQEGNAILVEIDYKISCDSCNGIFYIRVRKIMDVLEGKRRSIANTVNILDKDKNDLGWLGNF
ncbi:MAG: hypothetical protein ACXQS8_03715 [Candidatus Helarchaeales archaeon]